MCEQSGYRVFSVSVQIIDLFNLIYRIKNKLKNIETDRWIQIFFSLFIYLLKLNKNLVIA